MRYAPVMVTVLAVVLLWACGQKSPENRPAVEKPVAAPSAAPKANAPSPAKAVTVAELLRDPKAYAGKEVAVKGTFSGICCESDWFLKDGVDTIEVYGTKMCPIPSKKKIQSKLTVVGTVMVRNDQPALTSKELRFE